MKVAGLTLAMAGLFAGAASAQAPVVGGLLNNYSYTLPGLPNYGIARGSIVAIFGTNLASTTLGFAPPLQTSSNGVSVSITVNGTTTAGLLYFISKDQVNAVVPSSTPAGDGTLTVTTSAGTSAAFAIHVVESDFGLLTSNNGSGPVQGYDASIDPNNQYTLFGVSKAVNPGDILLLWGTGLGPVADDGVGGPVSDPVEVDIGGVKADVQYHGRSSYPGLDQINVVVPAGLSGCNVSVVVTTGNFVSNFGSMAIAPAGSRTCTDSFNPLTSSLLDQISTSGTFSSGVISLNKTTTQGITVGGITVGGGTTDTGFASFSKITYDQFKAGAYSSLAGGFASIGSCLVNFYRTDGTTPPPPAFQVTSLNAGPDVNIHGPNGLVAMPLQSVQGTNYYTTPAQTPSFLPATGGAFTIDNGSGGPDVSGFSVPLNMSAPLVWADKSSISTVVRADGITVHWTGGDPSTTVNITGLSLGSVDGSATNFVAGLFVCVAPTSALQFTVPASVLLSLPVSYTLSEGGITVSTSTLSLSNLSTPVTFTATGLDLGLADVSVEDTINVTYQ